MKINKSLATGLMLVAASIGSISLIPPSDAQQKDTSAHKEIPVTVKKMIVNSEPIPVDIQCEPVVITEPDTLNEFTCVLINKSAMGIRASGVLYTLIIESNGFESRSSRIDVADRFIHPDLSEIKKPIPPGGRQFILAPGPMSEPGTIIKGLEFEPVYLEFSDGAVVGTDTESIKLITRLREGAARFKQFLRLEYAQRGKSVKSIVPQLQEKVTIESQSSWDLHQRQGANTYRQFLLDKYQKGGEKAVSGYLKEKR